MPELAIIGENNDFCGVVAEHAARELGIAAEIFASTDAAKTAGARLVIRQDAFQNQKPLRLQELLAHIEQQLAQGEYSLGPAQFSLQQKTVSAGDKTVSLTDKESQLLLALIKNKSGVEKDLLLKDVWGVVNELESHTLETHIYRLRAKLKEVGAAATIAAAPGKYVLEL